MLRSLGLVLVALLLWGASTALTAPARPSGKMTDELVYFPSGRFLRQAALGYDQAAAAVAWLRLVQYYGEHVRTDQDFAKIQHMADIVTDLDPRFEEPYVFASFVLLTDEADPEASLELLAKGRRNNPDSWKILLESGLTSYLGYEDYGAASTFFRMASTRPGAPEYLGRYAAFMTEQAGSPEAALVLWTEALERATMPEVRERIEARIADLKRQLAEKDRS